VKGSARSARSVKWSGSNPSERAKNKSTISNIY
jgi:hypothetical protein